MQPRTTQRRIAAIDWTWPAWALPAVLLFGAVGCRATSAPQSQLSERAVRLDLPLVRQDALFDCGLASISALCQYWGISIDDEERAALARAAEHEKGLSGGELRLGLERLGFEVFLFEGRLDRTSTGLFSHVDAGRPLLVMLSPDGTAHHYGLVFGYDEACGNVILLDPMKGAVLVPNEVFDRNWARCRRFTLLAAPRTPRPDSEHEASAPEPVASPSKPTPRSQD